MKERSQKRFAPQDIRTLAQGLGHRVAENRLEALTEGVNCFHAQLAALDTLDLGDCERAEVLDFLLLRSEDLPPP